MALESLATLADLTDRGVTVTDSATAQRALDDASEAVRDAAGSAITAVTATVTLPGVASRYLRLPVSPVTAVSVVGIDGTAITDWTLTDGRLRRDGGWCGEDVTVTVTYGLSEAPGDVKRLVCELAAALLAVDPGSRVGVTMEAVDDYRVGFTDAGSVLELPERTRTWLRSRFGAGAVTTGIW